MIENLPPVEVLYKPGPHMTGEDAKRRATAFFQVFDGASETSDNPAVPDVPEDLGLLERNDHVIWDLKELVALASVNFAVKSSMESLNAKMTADGKATVSSVMDVIALATQRVELSS